MMLIPTAIPDALVCEPKVFAAARGYFYEGFCQKAFNEANSRSTKGVLRGRDILMVVVRVTAWPKPCQMYSARNNDENGIQRLLCKPKQLLKMMQTTCRHHQFNCMHNS